jgi:hypothetical protein
VFSQLKEKFSCLILIESGINDHWIYFIGTKQFIAKRVGKGLQFNLLGFNQGFSSEVSAKSGMDSAENTLLGERSYGSQGSSTAHKDIIFDSCCSVFGR